MQATSDHGKASNEEHKARAETSSGDWKKQKFGLVTREGLQKLFGPACLRCKAGPDQKVAGPLEATSAVGQASRMDKIQKFGLVTYEGFQNLFHQSKDSANNDAWPEDEEAIEPTHEEVWPEDEEAAADDVDGEAWEEDQQTWEQAEQGSPTTTVGRLLSIYVYGFCRTEVPQKLMYLPPLLLPLSFLVGL